MLRPRITPCLLVHDKGLVKTRRFAEPKYVGDPLNAVRIFNEKEVDEIVVLDIDATVRNHEPDYALIANLAAECRMPLCYGGGVRKAEQFERIIALGVEKVAISAAAVENPALVQQAARVVGNQSVAVVLDVRRSERAFEVVTHNATRYTGIEPVEFAKRLEQLGVGEIIINAVDQDGMMQGYELGLAKAIRGAISCPMTVLGGAGSLQDMQRLISQVGILGAAAGSLFVFKGVYRAVLINYPRRDEKDRMIHEALATR